MSPSLLASRGTVRAATVVLLITLLAVVSRAAAVAPDVQVVPGAGLANGSALAVTANAPIQSVGPVTQATSVTWDPSIAVLTGAAIAPAGWTPEYTTDGTTWSSTLPANPAAVTGARASGSVQSDGVSGGRQAVTTVNTATSVTAPPTFPAGGGGDGYDVFTSPSYIMTAFHHSADYGGGVIIDCWVRATGQPCSPSRYTKTGFETSYASNGVVVANKAYVMAYQASSGTIGLVCTDVSALPFADCGYTPLITPGPNFYNPPRVFAGTIAVSGTRIYGGIQNGLTSGVNLMALACFDTATGQPCAGQPYVTGALAQGGTGSSYTSAFDGKVFTVGRELWCINGADGTPCAGWGTPGSPTSVSVAPYVAFSSAGTSNPVPMRDASGAVTGVCVLFNGGSATPPATTGPACWGLNQSVATPPIGLTNLVTSKPVSYGGLQSYAFGPTRTYWLTPSGPSAWPVCFDWTTGAECANFVQPTAQTERYTITLDSEDPSCAYTYGNNAVVTTFNTRFGGSSCAGGPKMSLTAQASVPRLGCSADTSILAWGTIKVTPPGGVSVTAFRVTVRDSQGTPIPGYSDVFPDAQGVVDVSGLPPSASGQSPTITVDAVGATVNQANATTITVTRQTDYPQLCLPMQAKASCPAASPGSFPTGLLPLAPVTIAGTVVETPSPGSASTFPLSGSAARDSITGCLGGVDGAVRYTDGTPAAGRTVTLRAPDGTVIATATTSATGTYAFPANLGPATGYSVQVEGSTKTGDVRAGATTTVDFVLPLPLPVQASATREGASRGVIEVVVTVPGAGSVSVVGITALAGSSIRACTARRAVTRAGKVRVACRLSRPVRALTCRRPVKVTMRTTFTPRSGSVLRGRAQVVVPRVRCAAPPVTG